jgi:hypothetical protein
LISFKKRINPQMFKFSNFHIFKTSKFRIFCE